MGILADKIRADVERFRAQAQRNIQDVADLVRQGLVTTLDTPYPPASRPGESPRRRSGHLQASSGAEANLSSLTITLSNSARYARYLRPTRPWEDMTLDRLGPQIEEILLDRGYREALNAGS